MPRARIEGLLASFPKLIGSADQHTFVETDSVRYVYQPLEELFLILVTNKNSNILQDIDTLHLCARVVAEHCRSVDEKEVSKQAFDLLTLFDEIISLGYREGVTLAQIRAISEMESHEEKMQAEIEKNKEKEAKQELNRKVKQMDSQRREMAKKGNSGGSSGGFASKFGGSNSSSFGGGSSAAASPYGGGSGGGNEISSDYNRPSSNRYEPKPAVSAPAANSGRKGMVLGKKTRDSDLVEAIKTEVGVSDYYVGESTTQSASTSNQPRSPVVMSEAVHISIDEKISATANRDGGLQSMEVKGDMVLKVSDERSAQCKVLMKISNDSSIQYKTHPNVDKNEFKNGVITLKDPSRPFPVNQPLGLLKWRFVTQDESLIPLSINCWPTPSGGGACDVNIEYELQKADMTLTDVCISIPYSGTTPPTIGDVEGNYFVDRARRCVDWQLHMIDSSNASGVLEFSVATGGDDINTFFPVKVSFKSKTTFCDVVILDVVNAVDGSPIANSREILSSSDEYVIL